MENIINFKSIDEMAIDYPKEIKSMSFQNIFAFLRKSLDIKYTRRFHIDSILKKCKGKFFRAINDCLKVCVKAYIKKLPQKYITNISIDYNKKFFDFTLYDLYDYFCLLPYSMETIIKKNFCHKEKKFLFKYIFNSKISNLYLIYIQSNRFKREIKTIKRKKGWKVAFLHQFVAENFINYYNLSKPHVKKQKDPEKNITSNKIICVEQKEDNTNKNDINVSKEIKKNAFQIKKPF